MATYPEWLVQALRNPESAEPLIETDGQFFTSDGKPFPLHDGIPSLVYPAKSGKSDARWNRIYDLLAPFYDWNERNAGKLLTGLDIRAERNKIAALIGLQPGMKLLEVSPGPAVFLPFIRKRIGPDGYWVALDLSIGMLRQCRKQNQSPNAAFFHANGSYLPFADNTFDALFHFGGVNLFSEPQRALGEFVRVVKKGGIVAWGDEGFSDSIPDTWKKKLLLKMNPGYSRPRLPIPAGLNDTVEHPVYGGYAYLITGRKK